LASGHRADFERERERADTKRILVTSALPYINGVKHLGNLVGSMLPADVYARFQRQRLGAENVLFICATDEHGTPAELAALVVGKSVKDYCDHWHAEQKRLYEAFHLSFDYFGRSSSAQNRALTQDFAKTLWEMGFIEERVTKQIYSRAEDRFLPDRYVIGTCPHCGYEQARGDQCENCTRVLDPADLINPRSAISGSPEIKIRDSKHLFLKQTAFDAKLRSWIEGKKAEWPNLVTSIALKWLDEGLQDRGITRDLKWGVPVNAHAWGPNPKGERPDVEGLREKVFYVWFDAPIEYIGATWEWADAIAQNQGGDDSAWKRWWKGEAAAHVTYVEFMGKDNVPFHTVGFPCTIFGANTREPEGSAWKLVDQLKGFNWLNYYGGKFSTSQKRGVFMDTALELLPADYWRWYLIANAPESSDASFTWEHFQATVNKDLADVLGNFVNRIMRFGASRFGNAVPEGGAWGPAEQALEKTLEERIQMYQEQMLGMQFRRSAATLRSIWSAGNEYVDAAAPWTVFKADRDRAAAIVRVAINLIRLFAALSAPMIPAVAGRMLQALQLPAEPRWLSGKLAADLQAMKPGHSFQVPEVLFGKIEDAQVEDWKSQFGGAQ
jgi:methionyl-tRNA synthetase